MLGSSPSDTEVTRDTPPLPEKRERRGEILADKYELLRQIGRGSMGEVYEALHLELERRFAIKLLRSEHLASKRMVLRFMLETRAAGSLESSHIVPALDCGYAPDGAPYYVMELLRGEDLGRILRDAGRLDVPRAVHLALDVCRGLEVAHARGLVHRDLKPQNVFVTYDERGGELAKILDFGLVRLDRTTALPKAQSLLGTVRYVAPEQIEHPTLVDARADIYALGAVLYECLGGRPPHRGDTAEQVLARRLREEPSPLEELRPGLPRGLGSLIRRALARDPAERFQSAADLAEALEKYALLGDVERRLAARGAPHAAPVADVTSDLTRAERSARRWKGALPWFAAAGVALAACWLFAGTPRTTSHPAETPRLGTVLPREPEAPALAAAPEPLPPAPTRLEPRADPVGQTTTKDGADGEGIVASTARPIRSRESSRARAPLAQSASATVIEPTALLRSTPGTTSSARSPGSARARPLDPENPYESSRFQR